MNITLRFFASVREALGSSQETVTLPAGIDTVGQVRRHLMERGEKWEQALSEQRALRMACNQVMCGPDQVVEEGAEVAFFPPVTGG
ncbi:MULTISPECIES: molybdopterin converting factor subunit 1 [Massilia]|uniref:Molybdopterin converting factor subunit 1 n=2 Tax=Massilia TaxID=149698 RepID=A0ABX0LFG9_9BURK|nr:MULTISPECIES: molybdopterin converting factor subunit 1 [Massilia]NHZ32739.1 molybdopterin converting factor subunit 1 [Massilia rubra]NHZ61569.1 molybdopterin converting factor subunit 1 [Massilia genomosp. 1]NHZ99593.1 molybdopterin converting factor subunit 1 [Massilia sp. CCM 8734]